MTLEANNNIKVSIIIPTKNNGNIIARCLDSIINSFRKSVDKPFFRKESFTKEKEKNVKSADLDYPKDKVEIIIVDGHSTDDTVEIAKKYGCKVVYEDIGTIGGARDLGVKKSSGDFIAFTDADCVVNTNWIKNLIGQFKDEKIASVGGPNLTPDDDSEFAKCAGEILKFLSNPGPRYGFNADEVMEIYHNPTCNVMYRKKVLEEVGGFNHNLIAEDDEELDHRIKGKGYKILFTPDAKVNHYRRPTWKRIARMAFNYGVGRTQVIKLHRNMGRWYHSIVPALILTIVILFVSAFLNPVFPLAAFLILVSGGMGIGVMSVYLSVRTGRMKNFFNFYLSIAIWFWGYGFGMLRGLAKRVK